MAQISAEDVANGVGLAADELSKTCDNSIIPSLADCFSQWRVIFGSLLREVDIGDVDRENCKEEEKRIAALHKWKTRNGRKATYKILVDALLNRGERSEADNLCKILSGLADHLSTRNETTITDSEAEESESNVRFECPCGECSIETYLQDGCPKSCIPYLGMTTLSKGDQENLNYILQKDTKKIMKNFANLSNATCNSLICQGVTVDKLVRVAVTSNSSLHDKLTGSTSVDQVFTHLAPEMSFFNHEILAEIINELGDEDDKDHLADYSKEFKGFCKRKIFEVEPGYCTCGQRLSQLKQRKLFAVVLPTSTGEERLQNLGDAVRIKKTLADDLDIPLNTLHLHRIDKGSIILVFSVPDSVAQELFPLPKEKLALLKVNGMVLFVSQDMQMEENIMKPLACSADMHEPLSNSPTVPSSAPGEILVNHSLPTSAQLSWTPVPEDKQNDITGYTVQIVGPDFLQETSITGATTTSTEVSGLIPSTPYYFSVSAMTVAGTGPPIRTLSITPQGGQLGLYFTGDDDKREPATAEVVIGPISGESNLCINAQGMKEPLIVPVKQKTDAVLIKSITNIKQAWGVAINHKDQIVVIAGREGLKEEIANFSRLKAMYELGEITKKNKEGQFKGGKVMVDVMVERYSALSDQDVCILILSLDGEIISSFGSSGKRDGEFNMPRGVAVDEEDNIYVVDKSNSRIQKFSPSGKHLASVGKKGNGELEFDWPIAISIHPRTKNVYISEANNYRVQILKPDLTFIRMFGAVDSEGRPRMGAGNGEFNCPLGVAFDKAGRVYITDGPNDRIQIFTADGEYIAHFGDKAGDDHLSFPSAVCIDENDLLYVTEVDTHRISVFKIMDSTESSLPHSVSPPTPLLPMARAGTDHYTLPKFLTTFGKKSNHEPFYYGGIAVDKKGLVYVTDSYNDELQIFLI